MARFHVASVRRGDRCLTEKAEECSDMCEPRAWLLFSRAVWKVVCGSTVGFDGALAQELFAELTVGARLRSSSTLRRKSVCKVGLISSVSAALSLQFNDFCQGGDRTQWFDRAIEQPLVRLPLHLDHLRFVPRGHHTL